VGTLFEMLYRKSLEADDDCGGVVVCNYMAGEGITHLDAGRPLVVRRPDSNFTLANFFRAQLYSSLATWKLGMDILTQENVSIHTLTGHGGLFKTPEVGQRYLAAACNAPVTCMASAGEGGPYGMALLAAFMVKGKQESLEQFLEQRVFCDVERITITADAAQVDGFAAYMDVYKKLLQVERTAVEVM
jgi:sugar (pentulose or hexulose) kinase